MTKALENFKAAARAMSTAHYNLLRAWEVIDRENGPEREAVDKGYPFDCSFDELFHKIGGWLEDLDEIGRPKTPPEEAKKIKADPATPERLARIFSRLLDAEIGRKNMRMAIWANREEPEGSGVCHSHDFCDANMTMLAATEEIGLDLDHENNADAALWGKAWDIAAKSGFFLPESTVPDTMKKGDTVDHEDVDAVFQKRGREVETFECDGCNRARTEKPFHFEYAGEPAKWCRACVVVTMAELETKKTDSEAG